MNEERFGKEIKGYLNQGLDLPPAQAERLARAREQALARQRVSILGRLGITPALVPAWAGRAFGPLGVFGGSGFARFALPVLIAVAAAVGYQQYQSMQQPDDDAPFADIDTELLKSELPIDAYLDHGFKQWLKGEGQ